MTNSNLFSNTPIQYVDAQGTRLAYREFGGGSSVPLLMCQRFRLTDSVIAAILS
jgi:hypothetical protein